MEGMEAVPAGPSEPHKPTQEEVDEILRKKRKFRGGKACYPCAKRKVKCDSSEHIPCTNCKKRNHPEICSYEPSNGSPAAHRSKTTPPAQKSGSHRSPPKRDAGSAGLTTSTLPNPRRTRLEGSADDSGPELRPFLSNTGREDSFVGDNAAPSFVGDNARNFTKDLRPILGLQGPQYAAYPFLDPVTTAEQSRHQFISLLPRSDDVAKYFDVYRQVVFIHSPMLVDINGFENYVRSYMETHNAHERHPMDKRILETLEHDVAHIALLLATLASGSQFSDLKLAQRIALSRDFSRRSFQCLRLANFLFRPSMEVIQALLVLGTVLQCDGQSDGAWSLLGLTVRLAQCLGLHTERSARIQAPEVQERRKYLWNNVMWQDALLSLSYDRIPALAAYRTSSVEPARNNLTFVPAMHILCRIGLVSLVYSGDAQLQIAPLVQCLADYDELYQSLAPHLRSADVCTDLQEKREFLAFRLHSSFLVSMLARPAFRSGTQQLADQQGYDTLVERGRSALCAATQAYLDLHLIDVYPRRSWGMIHQGLSSALLLGILGESRRRPEIVDLQLRVIDVLSTSEEADVSGGDVPTAWLSSSHVRALRALRSTVQNGSRRSSQSSIITTEPPIASASITPAQSVPASAKDEAPAIPWVVPIPNGGNEMVFDPNLVNGYDGGIPMDFGMAMQHTGLSPMTYFDALYWDPNFDNMSTWNAPPQQGYWGL